MKILMKKGTNMLECNICSELCCCRCSVCKTLMMPQMEGCLEQCTMCQKFHDENYFGLAKCDYKLAGMKKADWMAPTPMDVRRNTKDIQ